MTNLPTAGPACRTADVPAPPATGDPMTTNVWDGGHRSEKSAINPIHGVWLGTPVRTGRGTRSVVSAAAYGEGAGGGRGTAPAAHRQGDQVGLHCCCGVPWRRRPGPA